MLITGFVIVHAICIAAIYYRSEDESVDCSMPDEAVAGLAGGGSQKRRRDEIAADSPLKKMRSKTANDGVPRVEAASEMGCGEAENAHSERRLAVSHGGDNTQPRGMLLGTFASSDSPQGILKRVVRLFEADHANLKRHLKDIISILYITTTIQYLPDGLASPATQQGVLMGSSPFKFSVEKILSLAAVRISRAKGLTRVAFHARDMPLGKIRAEDATNASAETSCNARSGAAATKMMRMRARKIYKKIIRLKYLEIRAMARLCEKMQKIVNQPPSQSWMENLAPALVDMEDTSQEIDKKYEVIEDSIRILTIRWNLG